MPCSRTGGWGKSKDLKKRLQKIRLLRSEGAAEGRGLGGGIPPRPSEIFPKSRHRDFPEKKFEF